MRNVLLTLCLSVVAVPLCAAGPRPVKQAMKVVPAGSIHVRDAEPAMVERVLRSYQQSLMAARKGPNALKRLRPAPDAITELRAVRGFIIPVAGNAAGNGGTFFRSDITLQNNLEVDQDVLSIWIASGTSSANPPAKLLTLPERGAETFFDYVGTVQQQSGIGSVFFIPIFNGQTDTDASIDGFSRIWTPQPGVNGTVSQPFDGVDPDSFPSFDLVGALGLRAGDGFRTNWFIVNASDTTLNFNVQFFGEFREFQEDVSVPPSSLLFRSIPQGDRFGALAIYFAVDDPDSSWIAGASSTDNVTGDGWVTLGSAVLTDDELDDLGQ